MQPKELLALGVRLAEHVDSTPNDIYQFIGVQYLDPTTELILLGVHLGQHSDDIDELLAILDADGGAVGGP